MIIFSHFDEIVIPSDFNSLTHSTFISCGVDPPNANFTSRWITPSGSIVTPNESSSSRLTVLEGRDIVIDRRIFDGTAIILRNISYQDEGTYICECRDTRVSGSPWMQAMSQLQLRGNYIEGYFVHYPPDK